MSCMVGPWTEAAEGHPSHYGGHGVHVSDPITLSFIIWLALAVLPSPVSLGQELLLVTDSFTDTPLHQQNQVAASVIGQLLAPW